MYYIYHIYGIKVGCTNNPLKRIEKEQGYLNYNILAKTECIIVASNLEIEWQKKLGYPNDKKSYMALIKLERQKKELKKQIMRKLQNTYYDSGHTTTFINSDNPKLVGYMFPKELKLEGGNTIKLNEMVIDYIKSHNHKSQNNNERFVYNKNLLNFVDRHKEKQKTIYEKIRGWAKERGIYDKGDDKTQYVKLMEENGELASALLKNNEAEIRDAIGDIVVVLTNLAYLRGYAIEDCIEEAYKVIENRQGTMINGTFEKK